MSSNAVGRQQQYADRNEVPKLGDIQALSEYCPNSRDDGVIKRRIVSREVFKGNRADSRKAITRKSIVNTKRAGGVGGHIPEGRPRVFGDPNDVRNRKVRKRRRQQNSMSHSFRRVDNSRGGIAK